MMQKRSCAKIIAQNLLRNISFVSSLVRMTHQERDRRITDVGTLKALAPPLRYAL